MSQSNSESKITNSSGEKDMDPMSNHTETSVNLYEDGPDHSDSLPPLESDHSDSLPPLESDHSSNDPPLCPENYYCGG